MYGGAEWSRFATAQINRLAFPALGHRLLSKNTSAARQEREPLWRCIICALPLVVVISLLTLQVHHLGWLNPLETTMLDTLVRLNPMGARHVFVVKITDSDYHDIFSSHSPLTSQKLQTVLIAILSGKPKVVVVDIDTSDASFRTLKLPSTQSTIVWARSLKPAQTDGNVQNLPARGKQGGDHSQTLSLVLGGAKLSNTSAAGVATLPEDTDGIVRHYYRLVALPQVPSRTGTMSALDTLPWAAVRAYQNGKKLTGGVPYDEYLIAFSGGPDYTPHISAGDLLSVWQGSGWEKLVSGKVVLLGGSYEVAHDSYMTPSGRMAGVDLIAQSIESELQRGGISRLNDMALLCAQLFATAVLVFLNWRFGGYIVSIVGFLVIPALGLLASLIAFSSFALWVDFVPVLFSVQLYFLYLHVRRVQQKNIDLTSINKELTQTKHALALAINRGAEAERRRLAQELHDGTLGQLFQVSVAVSRLVQEGKDDAASQALEKVRCTMSDIRRIMQNLYPRVLEKYGLVSAIRDLASSSNSSSIHMDFVNDGAERLDGLDKDSQLLIYRIVQEALNNVEKHSQATEARIVLGSAGRKLLVSVADNGKGIAQPVHNLQCYGVEGIKDKVAILQATINWVSPPDCYPNGTQICLEIPVNDTNENRAGEAP